MFFYKKSYFNDSDNNIRCKKARYVSSTLKIILSMHFDLVFHWDGGLKKHTWDICKNKFRLL